MKLVTVSRVTHAKLISHVRPGATHDDRQTEFLPDGSVRFPVRAGTYAALMEISPDPEAAILKAIGAPAN